MNTAYYTDVNTFYHDAQSLFNQRELIHNLPIGVLKRAEGEVHPEWLMALIRDSYGKPLLCALRTPPHNLILCATEDFNLNGSSTVLATLCGELIELGQSLPGVLGESGLTQSFAQCYSAAANREAKLTETLNLMQLTKVLPPAGISGSLRNAQMNELYYLPYWMRAFSEDCDLREKENSIEQFAKSAEAMTDKHRLYIWESDSPVCMAANNRNTGKYANIGYVYTPPHLRGKGYASACVAELSQHLLAKGFEGVSLFADAANPISNKIYHRIGFADVGTYSTFSFTEREEGQ